MAHSPSELWTMVEKFGYIKIDECIGIRMHQGSRRVMMQMGHAQNRVSREVVVHNPLAMLQTIGEFIKLRDKMRAEKVKQQLNIEHDKAQEVLKNFLTAKRMEYYEQQKAKAEAEQKRIDAVLSNTRPMIQAILARLKPAVMQYGYDNVYGQPAQVIFH